MPQEAPTFHTSRFLLLVVATFSAKLQSLMRQSGLTTREMGAALGLDHSAVARWLKGTRPYPSSAAKVAEFFGVRIDLLLDDTRELPEHPLRAVSLAVQEAYPNDPRAGQLAFEARNYRRLWKSSSLDTAKALRALAAELIARADQLELPFTRDPEE